MRLLFLRSVALVAAAPLLPIAAAAQRNPWAIDLGPYRSVSVIWRGSGNFEFDGVDFGPVRTTGRALFVPGGMWMTVTMAYTIQGVSDSSTTWSVDTGDTQASDEGSERVTVEPSFRALLARQFDVLAPAAKAQVLANLQALGADAAEELDAIPWSIGEKTGSATVAGQSCDVYTTGKGSICVLAQAPVVWLRFRGGSLEETATEIHVDVPVPTDLFAYPNGKPVDRPTAENVMGDRSWALKMYAERYDGNKPSSLSALAKFVVQYLSTEDVKAERKGSRGP